MDNAMLQVCEGPGRGDIKAATVSTFVGNANYLLIATRRKMGCLFRYPAGCHGSRQAM